MLFQSRFWPDYVGQRVARRLREMRAGMGLARSPAVVIRRAR
jgi:hypothetical protein